MVEGKDAEKKIPTSREGTQRRRGWAARHYYGVLYAAVCSSMLLYAAALPSALSLCRRLQCYARCAVCL